jgi:hypothetical protein
MPQMYFPRVRFNPADGFPEENIYGSCAMRKFMSSDYSREDVPDATTLTCFRYLLEEPDLQKEKPISVLTRARVWCAAHSGGADAAPP